MGQVCCGHEEHSPEMKKHKKKQNKLVRFFMTGLGSAGKTTVIRQLLILCKEKDSYKLCDDQWNELKELPEEDNAFWLLTVRTNIIDALDLMIKQLEKEGVKIPEEFEETAKQLDEIIEKTEDDSRDLGINLDSDEFRTKLLNLFKSDLIQEVWKRKNVIRVDNRKLFDGCDHFLTVEKIDAIFRPGYEVTHRDKLHARKPTTDMHTYRVRIGDLDLEINDVGGQKSELRRIIEYLTKFALGHDGDGVFNYILLVVPVSDFDVEHDEYEGTLLDECVSYMENIMNVPVAQRCGLFIFFNKSDRFFAKLNDPECRNSIKYLADHLTAKQINEFKGSGKFKKEVMESAVSAKFGEVMHKIPNRAHNTSSRFTCAVDSKMMDGLFSAIRSELIEKGEATDIL
ncbi:unnamed protein product [Bursaphelenchus xylophilus]|uniref:(pine wood nematode) hypothetical protein n=1 Tax=Bursaphelenchus xylophilus TaxID=6326 RepID=A0A1I7SR30_BURXY|nr:unnamed protein product [Bursaphelenchus xylophilus]CAG9110756.1 unnamed protein product [Bursaphelenchus xylophilus]